MKQFPDQTHNSVIMINNTSLLTITLQQGIGYKSHILQPSEMSARKIWNVHHLKWFGDILDSFVVNQITYSQPHHLYKTLKNNRVIWFSHPLDIKKDINILKDPPQL